MKNAREINFSSTSVHKNPPRSLRGNYEFRFTGSKVPSNAETSKKRRSFTIKKLFDDVARVEIIRMMT